ncbi:MAG: hypothetical protein K9J21_07130 [Bacteroidales bacterium]|nr:hypothetical protein [Bacteroidales bacterium]
MPYWFLNKQTGAAEIYGSIPVMAADIDLSVNQLKYQFSRLKKKQYETDKYRIVKRPIRRTTHKNVR